MLNALFFLFHIFLSFVLSRQLGQNPQYPTLQIYNVFCTFVIGFLSLSSLLRREELLGTRLGADILLLNVVVYAARAGSELAFSPQPKPIVLLLCLLTAALYGAIAVLKPKAGAPCSGGAR